MTRAAVSPAALRLGLAVLALLLAAPGGTRAQQAIGGYFTLVNTYFYAKAPHEGKRILVRPRALRTDMTHIQNNPAGAIVVGWS